MFPDRVTQIPIAQIQPLGGSVVFHGDTEFGSFAQDNTQVDLERRVTGLLGRILR